MAPKRSFEDFEDGFTYAFDVPALTPEQIVEFAEQYDPQRFHLDPEAAAKTHFGALVASGFQTQLLCFQPFCRDVLVDCHAVGAPGIDSLKWHRPWFPGEPLTGTVTLMKRAASTRRADRGYLEFLLEAGTVDAPVFSMRWTVIMLTREGAGEAAPTAPT